MATGRFRTPMVYLAVLLCLLTLGALACGIKAGDRRGARPTPTIEFHRSPVTAFEQIRIDLTKTENSCVADPSDLTFISGQRVRLAIQLKTKGIAQGSTGSAIVTGERDRLIYSIPELEISASGGAFSPGVTRINLDLAAGTRSSYDFNPANEGSFDILCDGAKIGTFTVNAQ